MTTHLLPSIVKWSKDFSCELIYVDSGIPDNIGHDSGLCKFSQSFGPLKFTKGPAKMEGESSHDNIHIQNRIEDKVRNI